ncbi:MAG: hypothetical protein K8L99_29290 [Anaerolineae bacterium]|nr:hypothetical protein [Anaerolineae bacterium]
MANTDRARKLLVRTALATSTTIATLVGAQNFAMLDARLFQPTELTGQESAEAVTPASVTHSAPEISIIQTAPSVTVLRQSGQTNAAPSAGTTTTSIQPPAPSRITVPQPVVVQRTVRQRSRSSR